MSGQSIQLSPKPPSSQKREHLVRWAKLLAWAGLGWHATEMVVSLVAGVLAGSIALIGFGADSLVESVASFIILWRFSASRAFSEGAERRAQKLIALSFFLITAYVGFEALQKLITQAHPQTSWVGVGLGVATLFTCPALAVAKARVGEKLGSLATKSEGRQNMLCGYLSAALLVGLLANALLGWWWADPLTALLIAGVAIKEGRDAWRGEQCGCCAGPVVEEDHCEEGCCR